MLKVVVSSVVVNPKPTAPPRVRAPGSLTLNRLSMAITSIKPTIAVRRIVGAVALRRITPNGTGGSPATMNSHDSRHR